MFVELLYFSLSLSLSLHAAIIYINFCFTLLFVGSRLYRLVLNFITWGALTLSLFIHPEVTQKDIEALCYHGGYKVSVIANVKLKFHKVFS